MKTPPPATLRALLTGLLVCAAIVPTARATDPVPPQILNLVAAQRPGTMFVDITYDLVDPDSSTVFILIEATSTGGEPYILPLTPLTGDFGSVAPGTGKKIVWNAWNKWAGNYTETAKVRLIADDTASAIPPPPTTPPTAKLAWIPAGAFNMGGTMVNLTQGFWMDKYEVTQAEFQAVMSSNPSGFSGPNRPVDSVTWAEAVQYCQNLTTSEQAAGRVPTGWSYRLPTEAEWEYACRAGTTTTYSYGNDATAVRLGAYAWFALNSSGSTHDVGLKGSNRWGLYDMMGNVYEWCSDWYGSLPGGNVTDPTGSSSGSGRVMRGGSWTGDSSNCTASFRCSFNPTYRNSSFGFRVVLAPGQ
ncbi:MAG: formylglycine-generating enzyme family protein [Verrucomicrobia bacterium]|nr:formylglycine-generating enzyme family protein [Verrucomicrobiota bacterium]